MNPTFIPADPRSSFPSTTALTQILLLDDDISARERVGAILLSYGFVVEARAWAKAPMPAACRPDILVLETLGHHNEAMALIAAQLDSADGPGIIIFSEISDESDRILALELGADDFIVKPSSPRELIARIRALVRRRNRGGTAKPLPPIDQVGTACFGEWRYHLGSRMLDDGTGYSEVLPNAEHDILATLLAARGGIVPRDAFFNPAASFSERRSLRSIDVRISRLRRRLHSREEIIRTVRGRGYKLLLEVLVVAD